MPSNIPELSSAELETMAGLITPTRLAPYLLDSGGRPDRAFDLYGWNLDAAAMFLHLTAMVEVILRNALDRELRSWAAARHPGESWMNVAPLDKRAKQDLTRARLRATGGGARPASHDRIVAELPFGFWRYLLETRYLTSLWVAATEMLQAVIHDRPGWVVGGTGGIGQNGLGEGMP